MTVLQRDAPVSNWIRSTLVVALLVVASPSGSRPAAASCPPAEPVAISVANVEVVFVGTVLSTASRDRVAQVLVEEVWKGPGRPEQVEVRTASFAGPDDAAAPVDRNFRPGVRYLFVPRAGSGCPGANGVPVFKDGVCTPTQEYHPNLDVLHAGSHPAAPGGVHAGAPPSGAGAPLPVLPFAVGVAAAVALGAALGMAARRAFKLDA